MQKGILFPASNQPTQPPPSGISTASIVTSERLEYRLATSQNNSQKQKIKECVQEMSMKALLSFILILIFLNTHTTSLPSLLRLLVTIQDRHLSIADPSMNQAPLHTRRTQTLHMQRISGHCAVPYFKGPFGVSPP